MSVLDYLLIGIVCIYMLLGVWTGLLNQILGIIGWILSLYGGYLFYLKGGSLFYVPLIIIALVVIFKVILKVIKSVYFTSPSDSPRISLLSRMGGGLLGAIKGIILSLFIFISVYFLSFTLLSVDSFLSKALRDSFLYSFMKNNELLPGIGIMRITDNADAIREPYSKGAFSITEEELKELRDDPSFKDLLKDTQLLESIKNRDYKTILSNPKFINLLKDRDFLDKLSKILSEQFKTEQ